MGKMIGAGKGSQGDGEAGWVEQTVARGRGSCLGEAKIILQLGPTSFVSITCAGDPCQKCLRGILGAQVIDTKQGHLP